MTAPHELPTGERLLVRADADSNLGSGHVMRCLSLAQAWQDSGGQACFACAALPESLETRLRDAGCGVTRIKVQPGSADDARATQQLADRLQADILACDGYRFDSAWQQVVRSEGLRRLLCIDDGPRCETYHADWLLNQNLSADAREYRGRVPAAQLLLGPRYALLDRQFAPCDSPPRETPSRARRILVTLGGADPPNATQRVIEALVLCQGLILGWLGSNEVSPQLGLAGGSLRSTPATLTPIPSRDKPLALPAAGDLEAVVVIGGANPHRASLVAAAAAAEAGDRIRLVSDTRDMARHMAWADLAICAGGSTCLELACLGVPALLVVIAENQVAPAAALQRCGVARILAHRDQFSPQQAARAIAELCRDAATRAEMSRRGRELVDGKGAQRVVRALRRPQVRLRPATAADCRRWWEWRNEPEVRRVSFHGGEIPFEAHCGWFRQSLDDARRRLLIVENAAHDAVGFVRLDFAANKAEISLGLDSRRRGQGYGEAAIRRAAALAFDTRGVESVEALAKQDNVASRRVFEHADFRVVEQTVVNGQAALRLLYQPGEAGKETPCT